MKTMRHIFRGVIPSLLGQLRLSWLAAGAALRRDGSGESRRKAAPTAGRQPLVLAFVIFAAAALSTAAAETSTPEISVSLRGVEDDVVEQGEPIRIIVRLTASPDTGGPIELAPASGAWSDAITVELAPASGGATVARAEVVGKASTPRATLDATRVSGGLWRMSSEAMQRVVPGDYVVRAKLAIQGGGGWNGDVVSEDTPIKVVAASASTDRVTQRTINQVQEALLTDHIEAAATIIDAVLQRTPNDKRLLLVRADIADRAGNPMAAMLCLNRACGTSPPSGNGQPPIEQEELQSRVMVSLFGDKPRLVLATFCRARRAGG